MHSIVLYISQDRKHFQVQNLCSECLLSVAKKTLQLEPVIGLLYKIGKEFTSCLSYNIVTSVRWQAIHKAENGLVALGLIREVCFIFCNNTCFEYCQYLDMLLHTDCCMNQKLETSCV